MQTFILQKSLSESQRSQLRETLRHQQKNQQTKHTKQDRKNKNARSIMTRKLYHILILLICNSIAVSAQDNTSKMPTTLEGWADRAARFGKAIPQEQIFVHMDNNCYFLGDTIYYKAYVQRSDSRKPSGVSGVLYADLYNQDGYLVERQQVEMKNGQCHGSFLLPDTLYSGFYELRAYTRWMLNWGITEHPHTKLAEQWFVRRNYAQDYYIDYEKLYSRTFPVYDKPKVEGSFEHNMTLRPLRKRISAKGDTPDLVLTLYPEGGNLVTGVPCRVAWEGATDEGLHKDGNLVVTDTNGKQVATSKTENRGRGTFTFVPQEGMTYTAQFTSGEQEIKAKLPKIQNDGCAIQVDQAEGKINIHLACAGLASQETLGMTVMCQGVQQDFRELEAGKEHTISLNSQSMRTGVNQVTIFDSKGIIWADRLFFVNNGETSAGNTLSFSGLSKDGSEPFAPVEVQIKGGVPGSKVSVAVRDAAHTEYLYDNNNIMTEMLLCSQVKGFIENPRYFFEKDDAEHQRALDLLLMIQGWRRYDWSSMATPGAFELLHQPERTPLMTGTVNKYEATTILTELEEKVNKMAEKDMVTESEREAMKGDKSLRNSVAENVNGDKIKDVREEMDKFAKDSENQQRHNDAPSAKNIHGKYWSTTTKQKRPVLVHAEFTKAGSEQAILGDMLTKNSRFGIQSPRFFEGCDFHLAAADTSHWGQEKFDKHMWIGSSEDINGEINYPDYYVKLDQYNPRFVKPYTWYQKHLAEAPKGTALNEDWIYDDARMLQTVTVTAKKNSYTRFDAKKPAYVVDAYDAFNAISDAGLCNGYFTNGTDFAYNIARYYIGDMNQERNYEMEIRKDSHTSSYHMSDGEREKYNHLPNLDKIYIYTDYCPRQEGSKYYEASNQPLVIVDLRKLENEQIRLVFRDRYYRLPGFTLPYEFYQPSYANKPLPEHKDYRRTLYWNPDVELDESGTAKIRFYNNGRTTKMGISAEGMAIDGTLQCGQEMPEDRK